METHSTVQLFLRFRAHGDLDALARVFDACAPKLLGVARHLVRDEALAEDAVQQTFVTAIEDAQRFDATRDLEAWLVGILTHKARDLAARDARTPDPARLDAARSADPASAVELADFVATLERALERVPAAYREVLRKNLADGRTPAEIAQDLARDPNTVRVQLHRGMEHLRRVLPAGFALGAAALASSPRGLVTLRAEVLEHASATAHAASSATTSAASHAAPSNTLAKSLSIAGAAALVLVSAAFLAFGGKPAPIESAEIQAASASSTSSAAPTPVDLDAPTPAPQPHAPLTVQAPATGALDVEVVWHDGTAAAGVEISVRPRPSLGYHDGTHWLTTGADGRVHVAELSPGAVSVGLAYANSWVQTAVVAGASIGVQLAVKRNLDVSGRVTRPDGSAAANALVWCGSARGREANGEPFGARGRVVAHTDGEGRYTARACPEHHALFATADGYGTSHSVTLKSGAGAVELALTPQGSVLELTVRDASGAPIADAWGTLAPQRRLWQPAALTFHTDAAGRAHLATATGRATLTVSATERPCTTIALDLAAGTSQLEVVLAAGAWVHGIVRDASGAPRADARVELDTTTHTFDELDWARSARTDADGRYRIGPFAAGRFALVAETPEHERGAREARTFDAHEGDELTWDFVLATVHAIRGRVVDAHGAPLADCEVGAIPKPEVGNLCGHVRTDALGRFEVRGLVGVPHEVYATAPKSFGDVTALRAGVLPDQGEIELQLAVDRPAGAFVVGRVTQAGVGGLVGAEVTLNTDQHGSYSGEITSSDGAYRVGPLPRGAYTGRVTLAGKLLRRLDAFEVSDDEQKDLGEIALPGFGRVKLQLHGAEGVVTAQLLLFLVDDQHQNQSLVDAGGGSYDAPQLLAGRYTLRTFGGQTRVPEREVVVVAGETTELALEGTAATLSVIMFTLPEGTPTPAHVRIEARRNGVLVATHEGEPNYTSTGKRPISLLTALPPGSYTCDATADADWIGHATFEIAPPYDPPMFRLEVPLVHR